MMNRHQEPRFECQLWSILICPCGVGFHFLSQSQWDKQVWLCKEVHPMLLCLGARETSGGLRWGDCPDHNQTTSPLCSSMFCIIGWNKSFYYWKALFLKNSFISEIVWFFSQSTDHFKWSIYCFMLLFFLEVEKLCKEIMLEKQSCVYFDIYING